MPVVQSSFSEDIAIGYPGMDCSGELSNIITGTLEGASTCAFGRPVYQGTADKGVSLTVSANLVGFALANKGLPVTTTRPADTYAPGDNVAIKERGTLWVTSTTTASKNDQVYVTAAGAITNVSTGNTAATGWKFDMALAAAGIVRIARR